MGDERRAPEVTVRDPSRPDRAADLLVSGDDAPRPSPFTRRRLQVAGSVAAVLALVAGGLELQERRAAAAEERRLARVLDLAVEDRGRSSSYDTASGAVTLDLQLRLRNDGPRDVAVESAVLGGYRMVQQLPEVPAGSETTLQLRKRVTCSPTEPPPPDPLRTLVLALRTAAGPREVELPVDLGDDDDAARACGFLPLEESVDITVLGAERREDGLLLAVEMASRSVREVVLAEVSPAPGLAARVGVLDQGEALLPVALPRRSQRDQGRGLTFELLLTVTDCRAAQTAPPELALRFADERGRTSQPVFGYEPAFLTSLVADSCSG